MQRVQSAQALAAGLHALPSAASTFAATQAAWRFLNNPRVGLAQLVEPLREAGRRAVAASTASHVLVVHDSSFLSFPVHKSKRDRIPHGHDHALGYDLATALFVAAVAPSLVLEQRWDLTLEFRDTAGLAASANSDRIDWETAFATANRPRRVPPAIQSPMGFPLNATQPVWVSHT